ncbi:MAG: sulfatase-like hydrolase/transferase, partial [Verrucomicrobiales bacterium]|nr:sulfatase-like hydrolase/transferase [Verrucomicrobiales bacterium]
MIRFFRLLTLLLLTCATHHAAEKPNIVLIFADDVGREVLGCYGGTSYKTPHLDALAAGGMRFTHAYAMPVCHPSRVCILTGKYPARMGNPRWGDFARDQEDKTFAHLLKKAGYRTAVAGKWQLALMSKRPDHCKT